MIMKQYALLLALVLASSADAQTSAVIKLDYPPMLVNRVRPGLLLTAKAPSTGTITLDTGTVLTVTHSSIPETYVRGLGFRKTVDACVATGTIDGGGTIIIRLPPEPVQYRLGVMTALAIDADVVIVLADGKTLSGTVRFPDCPTSKVGRGSYLAAAVVATGTATITAVPVAQPDRIAISGRGP
jgi:hypothetical protein